jgi:hypothetical protein
MLEIYRHKYSENVNHFANLANPLSAYNDSLLNNEEYFSLNSLLGYWGILSYSSIYNAFINLLFFFMFFLQTP